MEPPGVRYLDRDGHALAYQVVDGAPHNVVAFLEIGMHLDLMWTDPHILALLERVAAYARTVYVQRRGFGLSDQVDHVPTVEQQADDIAAVMDAAGMRRATLIGYVTTCGPLALLAARSPARVAGLVLVNPVAQGPLCGAAELHGWEAAEAEHFVAGYLEAYRNWGTGQTLEMWDPALMSPHNRRLMAMIERCAATPAAASAFLDWALRLDLSEVLRSVQAPTRVLCNPANAASEGAVRYVAELIPGASFHLLPPTRPGASIGEGSIPIFDQFEEMVTGASHPADVDRFLGSVVFTDIVGSTELLSGLGDVSYRELLAAHERQVRLEVANSGGRVVSLMGDGTFSVFDGPSSAVRCAQAICVSAAELGIAVRAGVHTGEIEHIGTDLAGMTVHIGARVGAAAGPGEVLVSRTVRDLVVGSGLVFEDRGERDLKGVPGRWALYALADGDHSPIAVRQEARGLTPIDRAVLQVARRAPRLARAAVSMANARQRRRMGPAGGG
ncbi:adenylate/guanylate cyclase domain-containing protein [Rhodococcus maanshanensis]|uniref:Adenylate cyclase, class 3 n=1 Tax=Rhodococcus maanshanensis TaxID=183556 RepID=A0A1H7WK52_9NOCA|nr:adenylate/guanylate cyclase domain-containing protein [Rhodococcus maanshanensis]SEM21505.1 Adenylate cyclase, class 3 [Rhodococcus maanshanensis]